MMTLLKHRVTQGLLWYIALPLTLQWLLDDPKTSWKLSATLYALLALKVMLKA
ncbi:hypothetical protein [Pectobacterium phage Jarilo]|uniref:Uncharacterized protein n=1 Tax=Pectobacterium phage Jarilo TaxID=2163634 RepID=A0A2S1GT10_9CAUD|nr:hypothetical protein HOT17_gp46 [Pectobacterium phage Jarilo]AWD92527.1 hypothetical protein [Pectobacterium phage Jarilo]